MVIVPTNSAGPRALYLDLLEKTLTNVIYGDPPIDTRWWRRWRPTRYVEAARESGRDWPSQAHTMIGLRRLHGLRELIERTLSENIAGDYIETGVWRGGACILMRGVLAAYGDKNRRVFCADSFSGLPRPDAAAFPADRRDRLHKAQALAVSLEDVKANFAKYGLLDEQVRFVKGWFRDALPALAGERFALLRLDGDMYESTMIALEALYPCLCAGGFVVVDDYGVLRNCRKAVDEFLAGTGEEVRIQSTDHSGVWWQKP